jgi:hypothetical protein
VGHAGLIVWEEEAWPLVVLTCPAHFSEDSLPPLIAAFEECHGRREKFALLIDTRSAHSMPNARWRKGLTQWANEPRVMLATRLYSVGTALLFSSSLARGAYTALLWFWSPPTPHFAAPTMAAAVEWSCQMLTRANVALGNTLQAKRTSLLAAAMPPPRVIDPSP